MCKISNINKIKVKAINIYKIKQYNSTYKYVVCKNGIPLCIVKSGEKANIISACLQGFKSEIEKIKDGKILKIINENMEE